MMHGHLRCQCFTSIDAAEMFNAPGRKQHKQLAKGRRDRVENEVAFFLALGFSLRR